MKSAEITILDANSGEKTIKKCLAQCDGYKWIYFGRNASFFYKIKETMERCGSGENINAGEMINAVARQVKEEFINFDINISLGRFPYSWYATDIAERNPYVSDFFYNCCALIVTKEIISKKFVKLVVFCEDLYLGLFIKHLAKDNKCDAEMIWGSYSLAVTSEWPLRILFNCRLYSYAFLQRLRFFLLWAQRKFILMRCGINRKNKYARDHSQLPEILLTLWADAETFKEKEYMDNDKYFGALPQYMHSCNRTVGYIAFPLCWRDKYKDIVNSTKKMKELVIFPEQCLKIFDVLCIMVLTLLNPAKVEKPVIIFGIDMTGLFLNEMRKEKSKRAQLEKIQFYFIGRYVKFLGITPKRIIHLYENQGWEKTLRIGIKKYFPGAELVGYQHTPFPSLYLNYFPSLMDINSLQVPDKIITMGTEYCRILTSHKSFESRLISGPALRFDYVFKLKQVTAKTGANSNRKGIILVACSIDYWSAFEAVYKTIDSLRGQYDYQIYIKLHPKMGRADKFLRDVFDYLSMQQLPKHIEFINEPIQNVLPQATVLFCDSTAVAYEAIALNIPVVFIESDIWFDMDELEWFHGASFQVRTKHEILEVLHKIGYMTPGDLAERDSLFQSIVSKSFNESNQDLLKRFCM